MSPTDRILADLDFCYENPEEFSNGTRSICHTMIYRTVAALNPEATRAEFVAALASRGINEATARIQFAQSRRLTLQDESGFVLAKDGGLVEKPTDTQGVAAF